MDPLDDDSYVAALLKNEAAHKSTAYSTRGLQALLPSRPSLRASSNAPKPNTRFLRNIVREADSHNAALRAKEAEESRQRLWKLQRQQEGRLDPPPSPPRAKQPNKRRAEGERNLHHSGNSHKRRRDDRGDRDRSTRDRHRSRSPRKDNPERPSRRSRRSESPREGRLSRSPEATPPRRRSRRSESPREHRKHRHHRTRDTSKGQDRRKEDRETSRSPERRRRKHHSSRDQDRRHSRERTRRTHRTHHRRSPSPAVSTTSSDPLAELIGPAPPSPPHITKGRGLTGKSAMDAHFTSSYDPSLDIHPPSPDNDDSWDNAVEAFRDRTKWKQQGAERLKAAGFDDEFIKSWENNAVHDEGKLQWAKKGAVREWDRGKELDGDAVVTKAAWGRGEETTSASGWGVKGSTREWDVGKEGRLSP